MRELDSNFTVEVDGVDQDIWYEILKKFDDANIYQTWAYDAIRCGVDHISHLVIRHGGSVVAAAQARIVKLPVIKIGIAYIRWGPIWKLKGKTADGGIFRQAVRALHNEYVCRRGLVLRLYPIAFEESDQSLLSILKEEGFAKLDGSKSDRTLIMDIQPPLEDLRKGLKQKWRNCLNRSERNEIEVIEGQDEETFDRFIQIYTKMLARKKFIEPNDINEFKNIQRALPENFKMKILLCRYRDEICVGTIFSAIGNTGIYLFGATSDVGMKSNGSYLLQWKFIEWLKENQFMHYDLNGINPETNPGTYRFKSGLCGKNGRDLHFSGQFQSTKINISSLPVSCGEMMRSLFRKTKMIIHNLWIAKE